MTCSICTEDYELDCVGIPEKIFLNLMSKERKSSWKCPQCISKAKKTDNTHTPIRSNLQTDTLERKNWDESACNVTQRTKRPQIVDKDCSIMSNDTLPDGDTVIFSPSQNNCNIIVEFRTLEKVIRSFLSDQEKREEKLCASLNHLQMGINGINDRLNTMETNMLMVEKKTETHSEKITNLEKEIEFLKQEVAQIKINSSTISSSYKDCKPTSTGTTNIPQIYNQNNAIEIKHHSNSSTLIPNVSTHDEEHDRLFVLYGLEEYRDETEHQLHGRIIDVFSQISGTNVAGFVEEITRIGHRGWRRPLKIEMLSKRMTKYLLANRNYFRGSGLWISEYLDETKLRSRNQNIRNRRSSKCMAEHTATANQHNTEHTENHYFRDRQQTTTAANQPNSSELTENRTFRGPERTAASANQSKNTEHTKNRTFHGRPRPRPTL